jgi:hypothetical protein
VKAGRSIYTHLLKQTSKLIRTDKEGHFILIKGTIHQKDLITVNIYSPNTGAPKFFKQILLDRYTLTQKYSHPQKSNPYKISRKKLQN